MARTNPRQYVRIPQTLLTSDGVKASTIATYASLASYADRKGFSFPSVPSIAKRAGLSEKIARRECDRLVKLGYLERRAHFDASEGQRSNRYTLIWQKDDTAKTTELVGQNDESSGLVSDTAPSSESERLTRSTKNQQQQSIEAAQIVTNSWRSQGKTQRIESVIRLVNDALLNGIDAQKLETALAELSRTNSYVSAYSLTSALNPKPLFTLEADRKVDWAKESENL